MSTDKKTSTQVPNEYPNSGTPAAAKSPARGNSAPEVEVSDGDFGEGGDAESDLGALIEREKAAADAPHVKRGRSPFP